MQKHKDALQLRAPPATDAEVRAASLQFVRKLSGFNSPSKVNQESFDREVEAARAKERNAVHVRDKLAL